MEHVLCKVNELEPGEKRLMNVGKKTLVLVRTKKGEYYALRNVCPHRGAELGKGVVEGVVSSSKVGEYCYGREGEMLRCPWHGFEFNVMTGENLVDKDLHVKSFDLEVKNGHVVVNI